MKDPMEDNKVNKFSSLKIASTIQKQNISEVPKTPLKILIVDDNQVNITVAERLLQKMGCTVYTASSGREGIEKLKGLPIECVFMDCQMPELSGFETTQLIRQGEAGSDKAGVFISALTAYADDENKILCYESGMDHFIPKPLRKGSFTKALDVLCTGRSPNLSGYREYGTSCLLPSAI
jgi:CheY-like chemotaxis protein